MRPLEFLETWDHLIDADPNKPKLYKGAQIKLLSEVLEVEPATVRSWGKDYNKMPFQYERVLETSDQLRKSVEAVCHGHIAHIVMTRLAD